MKIRPRFPQSALVAALLAFFAFFMSALISERVFARLPHLEDEMAYLYQAKTYVGGHLVIPSPEPRRAYWQPFLLDQGGNRFGKYTPGWSMQLALGVAMGQPWVINAFLAAMTVTLVYRLGREIFNPDVGVIGAALAAFSPMMLLLDGTLMGHTSALFAALLFLYAYWRVERGKRALLWGALAGIGLGLLVANRPITGIAFGAPLILWSGIRLVRSVVRWFQRNDIEKTRRDLPIVADEMTSLEMPAAMIEERTPLKTPATMIVGKTSLETPFPKVEGSATDLAVMTMEVELRPPRPRRRVLPFARAGKTPVYGFFATLAPLLILSFFTLAIASIVPINNYLAVGSPTKDLYTLVWSYDTIGFGECCGRSGHTLEKGIRQARFDLSLTAADLFGWQIGSMTQADGTLKPEVQNHLLNEGNYWEQIGVSWVLLPFAFLVAYRRKAIFIVLWVAAAYGLVLFALQYQGGARLTDPTFAWAWIGTALAWLYVPLLFWRDRQRAWTWLLWSAAIGLVIIQMAYWIGSQRYSTRYFYEGLGAIALISALPLAWLARRISRALVYGVLVVALGYSLYTYSTPRISVLKDYNFISGAQIAAVQAAREGDDPVLVIVNGAAMRWRAMGELMSMTSPYLNSDIVAAWNYEGGNGTVKQQILERFPDRQVIELEAKDNTWWFPDQLPPIDTSTGGGQAPQTQAETAG